MKGVYFCNNVDSFKMSSNFSPFLFLFVILLIQCEDGRQPILLFMEKPSRKLYPDYYHVIKEPIDLLTIEANIKNEKYASDEDALEDFKVSAKNKLKIIPSL